MRISARRRSQIIGYVESFSGTGLKFGIPLALMMLGYLLVLIFGPHLRSMSTMTAQNRGYLEHSATIAMKILTVSAAVAVLSFCIRLFYEEITGQILTVLGGLLYFFTPAVLGDLTGGMFRNNPLYQAIVNQIAIVGVICLLPGIDLMMRDAMLRVWNGINVRKAMERLWGDETEQLNKPHKPKLYAKCWEMPFCRNFVRDVCPAWKNRKSCWRSKAGCYCDEATIMRALTSGGKDNVHIRGIMHSLGLDQARSDGLTAKQRRMRCRRCGIYAEHQRQKYRVASPLMFPLIAFVFWHCYQWASGWMTYAVMRVDQFMSFLAYHPGTAYSFAGQQHLLTVLAMVWLAIIALSYSLRGLEYLIFELQV